MELKITLLSNAIGAEVTDIDLACITDDQCHHAIQEALSRHGVLVIRNQTLDEATLVEFTRCFGDVHLYPFGDHVHPDNPNILIVSNILDDSGKPIGLVDAGVTWHSDGSYEKEPPRGSVLYAREIPCDDAGNSLGDTLFSSTGAAYDDLPSEIKKKLAGRTTTHSFEGKQNLRIKQGKFKREPKSKVTLKQVPPVEHPIVCTHDQSGRKCLYVIAGECQGISGLPEDEATSLLDDLAERCTRPEYIYRHRWQEGDVVIWDNCLVQHLAIQDYALPQRRLLWRTTIKGSIPA